MAIKRNKLGLSSVFKNLIVSASVRGEVSTIRKLLERSIDQIFEFQSWILKSVQRR